MAEFVLTQAEADALMALEKRRVDEQAWQYPTLGGSISVPLTSVDKRESFFVDVWRARIALKGSYQNRARQVVVLVRLDFGGGPHRNPDDSWVAPPHLHLYREGFGDKWAMPAPPDRFSSLDDAWRTLEDFMRYCNVTVTPNIQIGLFP